MRAHELLELFADTAQDAEAVVLGQGSEEVLHGGIVGAGLLEELGDNLALVLGRQGGCIEDGGELGVGLELLTEGVEGLCGRVERGALGCGGVLCAGWLCQSLLPGGRVCAAYQGAGVGAVDAEECNRGLAVNGSGSGRGVVADGDASGHGGPRRGSPQALGESSGCEHGRGSGDAVVRMSRSSLSFKHLPTWQSSPLRL